MEQWNDPAFARSWAERNAEDNAERRQPLDLLQRIVSDHLADGSVPPRVLDLGCGHGVVAARILHELPTVSLVGVDGSPPMLELAHERLAPFGERCVLARADFETMTPADLLGGPFGVAVAVQSVHNSSDEGKKRALDAVHAVLARGGLFLLLDRVQLATPALCGAYRSVWEALGSAFNSQQREGGTLAEHVRPVAERGDKPGSLEQNLLWLREAGFDEVAVLYAVGVRALIAAVVS